jgi:hypothetical protein
MARQRRSRSRSHGGGGSSRRRQKTALSALIPILIAVVSLISRQANSSQKSTSDRPPGSVSQAEKQLKSLPRADANADTNSQGAETQSVGVDTSIGFRTQAKFDSHYKKHGREFGRVTQAEYLLIAQTLRDSPVSDRIVEAKQARGGLARFDRETGTFIAFDRDKTLLTCFKPDDGEDYFNRSIKRKV